MKKLIYILAILSLLYTEAFANPFDVLRQNLPDLTVSNIFQETNSEYIDMTICNIGGSMTQNGDLALGLKSNNSGISTNTLIKYVKLASGDCTSYRVGTAKSIGVYSGGSYNVKGGVKLDYYQLEQNSYNNTRECNIYLSAASYNSSNYNSIYNTTNNYNNDQYYCNGKRYAYVSSDTSYYCNGTRYTRDYNSSNYNSSYVSTDKYYCGGTRYNYNSNADTAYYCNGTRYSRNNTTYNNYNSNTNTDNQYYCNGSRYNYSSNSDSSYYCNGTRYSRNNSNVTNDNKYYCNGSWFNYSKTSDTSYYCNGTRYSRNNSLNNNNYNSNYNKYYCAGTRYDYNSNADISYYCNGTRYSRNNNLNNYNNNDQYACNGSNYYYSSTKDVAYYCNGSRFPRNNSTVYYDNNSYNNNADLQIDSITSDSNKRITAKICNRGGDMGSSYGIKTTFYSSSTHKTITKSNYLNLSANSCSYSDIYVDYSDLGFYYNGNVEVTARVEMNSYSERNTGNNEKTSTIRLNF